jgi:hypothetical protein
MKNAHFAFVSVCFIFSFFCCDNPNTSNVEKAKLDSLNYELVFNAIEDYNKSIYDGNVGRLRKYLYSDIFSYYKTLSPIDFSENDFISELIMPTMEKLNGYRKYDIEYSTRFNRFVGNFDLQESKVYVFVFDIVLSKNGKELITEDRLLAFLKNGKVEIISPDVSSRKVLGVKYSEEEIYNLLNFAWEGNFSKLLLRDNSSILRSKRWGFVALGEQRGRELNLSKIGLLGLNQSDISNIPSEIYFGSDSTIIKGNCKGKILRRDFFLDNDFVSIPLKDSNSNLRYMLKESGVDLYYLELEWIYKGKTYHLLFESLN